MAKTKPDKILSWKQGDLEIPVHVFWEWRKTTRVSIGKKAILIRVHMLCRGPAFDQEMNWVGDWLRKQISAKPELANRFITHAVGYKSGDVIHLFDQSYPVRVLPSSLKNPKGKIHSGKLELHLPPATDKQRIPLLVSRVFAKRYQKHFEGRVAFYNEKYFNKDIKSVTLKYNKSNWGSCSSSTNINLSTRLLFAPLAVQDYVVIHELAHLIEMNHSRAFWKIVSDIIPDYKEKENWLSAHGNKCFF